MAQKHNFESLFPFRVCLMMGILLLSSAVFSQVYNVNFGELNFGGSGVTISNKVGTGTSTGDIVVYENIALISGQQIDVIVRTQVITNGTCTSFDYTGTSQNNLERWFSPQFNFNTGGGYAEFEIEFILGGSYNSSTFSGTSVTLQNIVLNSYDIDGNGNANSNQYCDFDGFATAELGNPTNLTYSYDATTGLTRFYSTTSTNNTNAADEINRVRCTYSYASTFTLRLGGGGSGAAYYFIDFSAGDEFSSSTSIEVPELDLDTNTPGVDHDTTFIGDLVAFTEGSTNIIYSGSFIDSLKISFPTAMILDGADEVLFFRGSGGAEIPLNFSNGQSIPNITIGGNTYSVLASVDASRSKLVFYKNGSTMPLSNCESFLDSIDYGNNGTALTVAQRVFDVVVQDGQFASGTAQFNIAYETTLPVELISCSVTANKDNVLIEWSTASEFNNDYFSIARSNDGSSWNELGTVLGAGTSSEKQHYMYLDTSPLSGKSYYQLAQYDFDGRKTLQGTYSAEYLDALQTFKVIQSPEGPFAMLPSNWSGHLTLYDVTGALLFEQQISISDDRFIQLPLDVTGHHAYYSLKGVRDGGSPELISFMN